MNGRDKDIRKEITRFARMLYQKGMVNAYEGNVSARRGGEMWITPGSVCKGELEPSMLIRMDLDGAVRQSRPPYKPSSESKLHLAIYGQSERAEAVVHAHAPYATSFAVRGKAIETRAYPEMRVLFDKIPVLPYGTPSTEAVHAGLSAVIGEYDAFLLSNHGLVAVGRTVAEAYYLLESAEAVAKVLYLAELRGDPADLPAQELATLEKMHRKLRESSR